MRIGVDCDGVLYHWERTARYMLRRKLRREGRRPNPALDVPSDRWDYIRDVVEPEDWRWLWNKGVAEGLFRYGHVVGGSLEGMARLHAFGDLVIVTSRPAHAVKDTLAWLSLMTDKVDLRGIHILSDGQPKSTIVDLEGLDLLVDDGPHNAVDVAENTEASVILLDQPWNRANDYDGFRIEDAYDEVERAFDWEGVVRLAAEVAMVLQDEEGV